MFNEAAKENEQIFRGGGGGGDDDGGGAGDDDDEYESYLAWPSQFTQQRFSLNLRLDRVIKHVLFIGCKPYIIRGRFF